MKIAPSTKVTKSLEAPLLSSAGAIQGLEKYVRKNPIKAIGQAAAAGFFLRLLPVGMLLSTAMRLALPATCVALAMKSWGQERKPPARSRRRGR